ncbi:MAG: hypothetical protein E6431_13940 [Bradyrhizobium sp.]|nr:hypothetical protein [Bradyrhizobium sp.]
MVTVEPSAITFRISVEVAPFATRCTDTVRLSALVVVTVWSWIEPSALRLVTVSVLLPSPLMTVTSVRVRSWRPVPVSSHCVVFDKPSALVVVTVR